MEWNGMALGWSMRLGMMEMWDEYCTAGGWRETWWSLTVEMGIEG